MNKQKSSIRSQNQSPTQQIMNQTMNQTINQSTNYQSRHVEENAFRHKINKAKLDVMINSGLNPKINSRKALAQALSLGPTAINKWFAARDSQGIPRHPVVPEKHVTTILLLFEIPSDKLALDLAEFTLFCREASRTRQLSQNQSQMAAHQNKPKRPQSLSAIFTFIFISLLSITAASAWLDQDHTAVLIANNSLNHTMVTADQTGNISLWDSKTQRPYLRFRAHDGSIRWLKISADGHYLFTSGEDGSTRLWAVHDGSLLLEDIQVTPELIFEQATTSL